MAEPEEQSPQVETWHPFRDMERFRDFFAPMRTWWPQFEGFTPFADVEERDDAFVLEVELPGVKKGDIEIAVEANRIAVSGERRVKERTGMLRQKTRTTGKFHYEVRLPGDIAVDDTTAELTEGVLTITAPKSEGDRARKIKID